MVQTCFSLVGTFLLECHGHLPCMVIRTVICTGVRRGWLP